MNVTFKVTGQTKQQLEVTAKSILDRFLEGEAPAEINLAAYPIAEQFQEEHPAMWEAEVRAEV